MYGERGVFIDGAWRQRGGAAASPVLDPSSEDPVGTCPAVSPDGTGNIDGLFAYAFARSIGRQGGRRAHTSGMVGINSFALGAADAVVRP